MLRLHRQAFESRREWYGTGQETAFGSAEQVETVSAYAQSSSRPFPCPRIVCFSPRKPRFYKRLFYPPLAAKGLIGDPLGRKDTRSCFGQTTPKRRYLSRPIVHPRQPGTPGTAAICRVWAAGNGESRPASSLTLTDHSVLGGPQRLLPQPPNLNTRMRSMPRQKRPPGAQSPILYWHWDAFLHFGAMTP